MVETDKKILKYLLKMLNQVLKEPSLSQEDIMVIYNLVVNIDYDLKLVENKSLFNIKSKYTLLGKYLNEYQKLKKDNKDTTNILKLIINDFNYKDTKLDNLRKIYNML